MNAYLAAAALNLGIAPFTRYVMLPTNFRLIELNERLGGARSQRSAEESTVKSGERSAVDSVRGEGDISEFTDLSVAQERTTRDSSAEEDEEVRELLGRFGRMNAVRAGLMGVGGVVGLMGALL